MAQYGDIWLFSENHPYVRNQVVYARFAQAMPADMCHMTQIQSDAVIPIVTATLDGDSTFSHQGQYHQLADSKHWCKNHPIALSSLLMNATNPEVYTPHEHNTNRASPLRVILGPTLFSRKTGLLCQCRCMLRATLQVCPQQTESIGKPLPEHRAMRPQHSIRQTHKHQLLNKAS